MSSVRNQKKTALQPAVKKSKKKMVIAAAIAAAILLVGASVGITVKVLNDRKHAAERQTVALCNGYEIPYEELRFLTLMYKDSLEGKYGEGIWDDPATAEKHREELQDLVMRNLNKNYLILSACNYLSIPTESREIDNYVKSQIKELRDECGSRKEYKAMLEEYGMTENYLRFSIGVSFLESALYYALLDGGMYEYTQDNFGEFLDYVEFSGDYARTIHVYIANEKGDSTADNLAKAEEISEELQALSTFDERYDLICEYIGSSVNDDLQSISGDGYYFTYGEMDEDYEKATFAMEVGDVSDPVVCSGGNFVIMRMPLEEEYIAKNAQTLLNYYHSAALGKFEDGFRHDCVVKLTEYGQSLDILAIQ